LSVCCRNSGETAGPASAKRRRGGLGSLRLHSRRHESANDKDIVRGDWAVCTGRDYGTKDGLGHTPWQPLGDPRRFGRSAGDRRGSAVLGRIIIRPGLHGRSCRSRAIWGGEMTARDHVPLGSRASSRSASSITSYAHRLTRRDFDILVELYEHRILTTRRGDAMK
jgi:hypothetical protein